MSERNASQHQEALPLEGGGLGGGVGSRVAGQDVGGVYRGQPGCVGGSTPIPDPSPLEGEGSKA